MNKKKITLVTIATLSLLIVLTGFAFVVSAGAGPFFSGHRKTGFHKGGMPPFLQKEIGQFIIWRMDSAADALNLNSSQRLLYGHLKANVKESFDKGIAAKTQMKALAQEQMEKDQPDISVITNGIQEHMNTMAGMMDKTLGLFHSFYSSLDDKQKEIINTKFKDRFDQVRQHRTAGYQKGCKKWNL